MARGQMVCQKHYSNGNLVGRSNQNLILDTHIYEKEFPGVTSQSWQLTSLHSQCMPDVMKMTMNTTCWIHLLIIEKMIWPSIMRIRERCLKGEGPLERQQLAGTFVASGKTTWHHGRNYSILRSCTHSRLLNCHSPGHSTWAKRQDNILSEWCSAWYLEKTHKFGIELKKMANQAIAIDKKNENTYWQDIIAKQTENVKVTFWLLPTGKKAPNGFNLSRAIWCLMLKWKISEERHI